MAVVEWLESLGRQHRVIESTLHDLERSPSADGAEIKRLKIEKLALKDRMSALDTRQLEAAE